MQVLTDTKIAIEFEVPDMVNGDLEEFIVTYTESRDVSFQCVCYFLPPKKCQKMIAMML